MPEFRIEDLKSPESDWTHLLETVSEQKFLINTSIPGRDGRTAEYARGTSERLEIVDDTNDTQFATLFSWKNKNILKRSPEVVVFTPDNKLLYVVDPTESLKPIDTARYEQVRPWDRSESEQVSDYITAWHDVHSFPPRAGNHINLLVDLEENLRKQLETAISQDPLKVRQILEKIVDERMRLKTEWRKWNPDNLNPEDFKDNKVGTIRPPWEFWQKLGLNEIFVRYSDSTDQKPHEEYRKVESIK